MRHRALAAIALTVSVAMGGAVLGTVALVADTSASSTFATSPAAPASRPPQAPASVDSPASTRSLDPSAMAAGFVGPYRFVTRLSGLPGLMNLGGVVRGVVRDPAHFVLDFPESTFITHYTRDGASARAVIGGQSVRVDPGADTAGAITPEDMLPTGIWAQVIAPWAPTLIPDTATGSYSSAGALTEKARAEGIRASNWRLVAKTDGPGRLTSLAFSGRSWDQSFELELEIVYE